MPLRRRFKEAGAEFIVSAATKRNEREGGGGGKDVRGNIAAGCDPSAAVAETEARLWPMRG